MIAFTAPLWVWSGEGGRWHFFTVPEPQSAEIRIESSSGGSRRGFGSVRIEARVGAVAWRTSVFPQKEGTYLLPVKAEVRLRAGLAAGDVATVGLELL